jgi:hypothetical protein
MRILALSDTHHPENDLLSLDRGVLEHRPDWIVIAGDMLDAFDEVHLAEYLSMLARYDQPKLCVLGNHDLWHEQLDTPPLFSRLRQHDWGKHGIHLLNNGPVMQGSTAFVGTTGWYDYSLYSAARDFPDLHVYTHDDFRNWEDLTRDDCHRLFVPRNRKRWSDLSESDFARKVIVIESGSELQSIHCNDRLYIRWGVSDSEVSQRFAADLEVQLKQAQDVADHVIAVLHYLPFRAGVMVTQDPVQAGFTPYLGAAGFGDLVCRFSKVKTLIHGHSHTDMVYRVGGITCYSCTATARLIEIET